MKARQRVAGHADDAVPLRLELYVFDAREHLGECALRPGAMDREPSPAQRADAAEKEAPGAIEAEGAQDKLGVPAAFASRQNRSLQIGAQGSGGETKIGQANLFAPPLRPGGAAIDVGRDRNPVGRDGSTVGRERSDL